MKNNICNKTISLLLVISMVGLDVAWAYPEPHARKDHAVPAPDIFFKSNLQDPNLLLALGSISRYIFGDDARKVGPLSIKHMGRVLLRDELKGRETGLSLSEITWLDEGKTTQIPYTRNSKGYWVHLAKIGSGCNAGVDGWSPLPGNDKCLVKIAPREITFKQAKPSADSANDSSVVRAPYETVRPIRYAASGNKTVEVPDIGDRVGGLYKITELISEGGEAKVYKALSDKGKEVAVKIREVWDRCQSDNYNREITALTEFKGKPFIPELITSGQKSGYNYIVMEYLAGNTLAREIEPPHRLNRQDTLNIIGQVLDALSALHRKGYIYADLKPRNIMVMPDGAIKLIDFGFAHKMGESPGETNETIGTPTYMSPEAARGKRITERSDIYQVGIVLYEMLSGRRMRAGTGAMSSAIQAAGGDRLTWDKSTRIAGEDIAAVIDKAMKYDPNATDPAAGRYNTAAEMKAALEHAASKPRASASGTREEAMTEFLARHYNLINDRFVKNKRPDLSRIKKGLTGIADVEAISRKYKFFLDYLRQPDMGEKEMWYVTEVLNREVFIPNGLLFIYAPQTTVKAAGEKFKDMIAYGKIKSKKVLEIGLDAGKVLRVPLYHIDPFNINTDNVSGFCLPEKIIVFNNALEKRIKEFTKMYQENFEQLDREGREIPPEGLNEILEMGLAGAILYLFYSKIRLYFKDNKLAELRKIISKNCAVHEGSHHLAIYLKGTPLDFVGSIDANPDIHLFGFDPEHEEEQGADLDRHADILFNKETSALWKEYQAARNASQKFAAMGKAHEVLAYLIQLLNDASAYDTIMYQIIYGLVGERGGDVSGDLEKDDPHVGAGQFILSRFGLTPTDGFMSMVEMTDPMRNDIALHTLKNEFRIPPASYRVVEGNILIPEVLDIKGKPRASASGVKRPQEAGKPIVKYDKDDIERLKAQLVIAARYLSLGRAEEINLNTAYDIACRINPEFTSIPRERLRYPNLAAFIEFVDDCQKKVFFRVTRFLGFSLQGGSEPTIAWGVFGDDAWEEEPCLGGSIWINKAKFEPAFLDDVPKFNTYCLDRLVLIDREKSMQQAGLLYAFIVDPHNTITPKYRDPEILNIMTVLAKQLEDSGISDVSEYGEHFVYKRVLYKEKRKAKDYVFTKALPVRETEGNAPKDPTVAIGSQREVVEAILKKKPSELSLWAGLEDSRHTALTHAIFVNSIREYASELGGLIDEMEEYLGNGRDDLAYAAFLDYLAFIMLDQRYHKLNEAELRKREKEMDVKARVDAIKTLNFTSALAEFGSGIKGEKISSIGGVIAAIELNFENPGKMALDLVKRVYAADFLTDEERKERLDQSKRLSSPHKSSGSSPDESSRDSTNGAHDAREDRVNAESLIVSLMVRARQAKRSDPDQKFIIGLENYWVDELKEGKTQMNAMQKLNQGIYSVGKKLEEMGLDNIIVVRGKGAGLAEAIRKEMDNTMTAVSNVVVIASRQTLESDTFNGFRMTDGVKGAVLFGIDPSLLNKYYLENPNSTDLMDIDMLKILAMALAIAAGDEPPNMPELTYDGVKKIFIFLPRAAAIKYDELRDRNKARRLALEAA